MVSGWFSPGTSASSTTKIGRYDKAEILLKAALKYNKSINQSINDITKTGKSKKLKVLE
jgi:hypothetical protein